MFRDAATQQPRRDLEGELQVMSLCEAAAKVTASQGMRCSRSESPSEPDSTCDRDAHGERE